MGVAGEFIKIDAEVHRIRLQLKTKPKDNELQKELNSLMKVREKLLVELDRKNKARIVNENYKKLKGG